MKRSYGIVMVVVIILLLLVVGLFVWPFSLCKSKEANSNILMQLTVADTTRIYNNGRNEGYRLCQEKQGKLNNESSADCRDSSQFYKGLWMQCAGIRKPYVKQKSAVSPVSSTRKRTLTPEPPQFTPPPNYGLSAGQTSGKTLNPDWYLGKYVLKIGWTVWNNNGTLCVLYYLSDEVYKSMGGNDFPYVNTSNQTMNLEANGYWVYKSNETLSLESLTQKRQWAMYIGTDKDNNQDWLPYKAKKQVIKDVRGRLDGTITEADVAAIGRVDSDFGNGTVRPNNVFWSGGDGKSYEGTEYAILGSWDYIPPTN